jgi:hypothetical protein
MFLMRSPRLRTSLIRGSLAVLALCGVMAGAAQARIFIGFGGPVFFPPYVVAPPYYYAPYYAPPAVYAPPGNTFNYTPGGNYSPQGGQPQSLAAPQGGYTPSRGYDGGGGQSCQAGAYVCPLVEDTPPGAACSCPGHNGQRIRGQAD